MVHLTAGTTRGMRHATLLPLLVVIVTLLALAASSLTALAETTPTPVMVSGTPVLISGGAGSQTDAHISGTLVSYTNGDQLSANIHYHDLATGFDTAILNDGHKYTLSDVSGTTVVFRKTYTDGSSSTSPIMAFDTANPDGQPVELNPTPGALPNNPSIGGRTVVWELEGEHSYHTNVMVHDLDTEQTTPLTSDETMSNRAPAVSDDGTVVTWSKCLETRLGCDIYAARKGDGWTWTTTRLTGDGSEEHWPTTNGQVVAYASNVGNADSDDFDIWWENVDGTSEHKLSMSGKQMWPNIAGNLISFESEADGTTNRDLFVYDLATGNLYQITNTPDVSELLSDVSVDSDGTVRVVWAQNDGPSNLDHDYNVYAMTFQFSSNTVDVTPLFDQSRSYRLKSTVPIRLQLFDANGQNLSSPSLVVTATELVKLDGTSSPTVVEDTGNANPDNNFRYDETIEGYAFNLSTQNLSAGTWELRFTIGDDPTTHSITFDLH